MTKIFFVFISALFFLFISCNNYESDKAGIVNDTLNNHSPGSNNASGLAGCYKMVQQKDTALLNLNVLDSNVSGKLQYRRFEKDRNDGTISGVVRGSLIIANYTFQSEGISSVRELVFSIRGDSLFEGYGEITVKNDSAKFVNTAQLKFMMAGFVKVDCEGR
jgi:hypothetical protein